MGGEGKGKEGTGWKRKGKVEVESGRARVNKGRE